MAKGYGKDSGCKAYPDLEKFSKMEDYGEGYTKHSFKLGHSTVKVTTTASVNDHGNGDWEID